MLRLPLLLALCLPLLASAAAEARPRVIVDLDIDSDVDDVQALALAHTLADAGHIDLAGVIVTSDDPFAPACVAALNRYFGRRALPVGFLQGQSQLKNHSRYTRQIATEFPHDAPSLDAVADAAVLYRQLLAASPDGGTVIVTLGHLTSLQRLLQSAPDALSPLDGRALAARKVQRWICMGGQFPRGKEANFYRPDPASTVYCVAQWPGRATFCGWEVGNLIRTGGAYLRTQLPADSPVYRAYQLYNDFKGRASWDQVAVLLLAPEADTFFATVGGGSCRVAADGSNAWDTTAVRAHEYVVLRPGVDPERIARRMDDGSRRR